MLRAVFSSLFAVALCPALASAAIKAPCPDPCAPKDVEYVEKTICVPTWVNEVHTVKVTEYRKETQMKDVTKHKAVKVDKVLECKHTVFVPAKRLDVQVIDIAKPVSEWVEDKKTVMVPHEEIVNGCKVTVCKPEERVCRRQVWSTVHEEKRIERLVCTIEPKVIVKPYMVPEIEWQPYTVQEPQCVFVPYEVEKKVTIRVCKMVQQTVRVPKCCD